MEALRGELARAGLNVQAVADGRAWSELLPGCRSVVVFGSGGGLLWERFLDWLGEDPRRLTEQDHPLDHFVEQLVSGLDPAPVGRRWVFAAAGFEPRVGFQELARQANLAWDSRLFLLLHPSFGPWLGLRAACLTTQALPISPSLGPLCALHRARTADCRDGCLSRQACPVGSEHRYTDLELLYHSNVAAGRPALAAHLGVEDARRVEGTNWKELARLARSLLPD